MKRSGKCEREGEKVFRREWKEKVEPLLVNKIKLLLELNWKIVLTTSKIISLEWIR